LAGNFKKLGPWRTSKPYQPIRLSPLVIEGAPSLARLSWPKLIIAHSLSHLRDLQRLKSFRRIPPLNSSFAYTNRRATASLLTVLETWDCGSTALRGRRSLVCTPVRCYDRDQCSAHNCSGSHYDPGKIVAVVGIKDSSRQPGCEPLAE